MEPYRSSVTTTTFHFDALSPERLEAIRSARIDDSGNVLDSALEAEGGEPLRCCLRLAKPGEQLLLISYRPFDQFGPYAEAGPVFVHSQRCDGYPTDGGYPEDYRDRQQVFRCYDDAGRIIGGRLSDAGDDVEAVIAELFSNEKVALIHTRNVVFGCYMLQIRRSA